MLFMLARMMSGTTHKKWVKFVAAWVITGYIAVQIAFWTACIPLRGYWSVPAISPQCTTLEHYAIVQASFNISSDLLIIAIPIPMVVSLVLPLKQKISLGLLFSMGSFVVRSHSQPKMRPPIANPITQIVAAILTKIYNLSDVYSSTYMLWYTREASVAVYVANLPGIWPARTHKLLRHGCLGHQTPQIRLRFPIRQHVFRRRTQPHAHPCRHCI
jgi:hypothetical protein